MGRWEPNAQSRLQQAAMELFRERGFDRTSVAEIADRAGLTERTFFRHFTDKREVLFAGSYWFINGLHDALANAPEGGTPLETVQAAFEQLAEALEERRAFSRTRHAVINANPELLERERQKLASLAASIAAVLRDRGVDDARAVLASEVGIALFRTAYARWADDTDNRTAREHIREAFTQAKTL